MAVSGNWYVGLKTYSGGLFDWLALITIKGCYMKIAKNTVSKVKGNAFGWSAWGIIIIVIAIFILKNNYGVTRPGAFFERGRDYTTKIYVQIFPD